MFKNLRISLRLALAFGLLVLLLLATSAFGLIQMSRINGHIETIVGVQVAAQRQLNTVYTNFQNTTRTTMRCLLQQAFTPADKQKISSNQASTNAAMKKLAAMELPAAMVTDVENVKAVLHRSRAAEEHVIDVMQQNNFGYATSDYLKLSLPVVRALGDAMKTLTTDQEARIDEMHHRAQADYARALTLSLVSGGIGVLLAIGLGLWITRSITRPLSQAVGVAQRVAEGDLSVRIVATSRD
ncbi:MAG: MCP four helix bundle domain-containing protein, partial [Thiomonas sp.]